MRTQVQRLQLSSPHGEMMKTITIVSISCLLLACQPDSSATAVAQQATVKPASAAPAAADINKEGNTAMDIASLVPDGYKTVSIEKADLDGDGAEDALLLVEEANNGSMVAGEGAKRILHLVLAEASGKYRIVSSNEKIVPCKTCGGIAGDPFAYVKAEDKGFVVVVSGGSRERWSSEYRFTRPTSGLDWMLSSVKKDVVDTESDAKEERSFGPAELGQVSFSDFDPAKVPEVVLP